MVSLRTVVVLAFASVAHVVAVASPAGPLSETGPVARRGEALLEMSFTEGNAMPRLELERLGVELTIDDWDRCDVHPAGFAGWLTGRKNEWNAPGHSDEEILADMFNDLGNTLPVGITAGLLLSESSSSKAAGRDARDAILVTSAATHLLKSTIDSPRPADPEDLNGFPSGHTSMSVTFARAIDKHHSDWGTAAYLWAGGVAWSRVHRGDHTIEQVLAGALLGWAVADAVADGSDTSPVSTPRGGGPMIPAGRASW